MTPRKIAGLLEPLRRRAAELDGKLADPELFRRPEELKRCTQELRRLQALFQDQAAWEKTLREIAECEALAAAGPGADPELTALAEAELPDLRTRAEALERAVQLALLPPDPDDGRNIIVEMHPAAGGEEAALFTAELCRAYLRFAERCRWKAEVLEQSSSELGGLKNVTFSLSGEAVYSRMKFEAGVHRVQRIPVTEAGGRIHTSTITVAILPEAEAVELELDPNDLRIDVYRSSGPGGQGVNTTDSAVRITHLPTGISAASQQERSQHRNREIALRILSAKLLEQKRSAEQARLAADKRAQVGTGDRSERIRTYNFPQNRATDHRWNVSCFDLPRLMEGELELLLDAVRNADADRRLAQLEEQV